MTFSDAIKQFTLKVDSSSKDVFANIVSAVQDSIVNGSEVTGAPGQPVGQYGPGYHNGEVGGNLKTSWETVFDSPTSAFIATNIPYALSIEDGVSYAHGGSPMRLRSSVGGFHSVALTVAGFADLVASEAAKAQGFSNSTTGYAGEDGG